MRCNAAAATEIRAKILTASIDSSNALIAVEIIMYYYFYNELHISKNYILADPSLSFVPAGKYVINVKNVIQHVTPFYHLN